MRRLYLATVDGYFGVHGWLFQVGRTLYYFLPLFLSIVAILLFVFDHSFIAGTCIVLAVISNFAGRKVARVINDWVTNEGLRAI